VVADLGQRPAVCVEVDRFGHLFGCQGAATIREAVTVEFSGDRRPMNPEARRELLLRRTFFVASTSSTTSSAFSRR